MKSTVKYISAFIAGILFLTGCDEVGIDDNATVNGPHIALKVKTAGQDPITTKASENGEDTYNENLLSSYYYFFFATDVTDQPAIAKGVVSGLSENLTSGYSHDEIIPVSAAKIDDLFDSDNKCSLFVIANPTSNEGLTNVLKNDNATLADLRAAVIISNMDKVQDNFVMVFDDVVTASNLSTMPIEISAELTRLACKFTIKANVVKTVELTDAGKKITWTAATDLDMGTSGENALSVTLGNGINKTTPVGFVESKVTDGDYFEGTPVKMKYIKDVNIDDSDPSVLDYRTYTAVRPIYSYSMDWVFTDNHEPYILFDLVWNYKEEVDGVITRQLQEHRYYKLVLGQQSITANEWYEMTVKLSVLGNLLPRDPLAAFNGLNYLVHDWNDAFSSSTDPNTPANIKAAWYLVVPTTVWTVSNENSCEIPITHSHECTFEVISATRPNIYPGAPTSKVKKTDFTDDAKGDETASPAIPGWFHFNEDQSLLIFEHNLDNNMYLSDGTTPNPNLDFAPYTITVKVSQESGTSTPLTETITITQYPALYIRNQANSGGNNSTGYVYVNKNNAESGGGSKYDHVKQSISSGNDMYVISVSQFSTDKFVIGDPRETSYDSGIANNTGWHDWSSEYGKYNSLQTATALYENASGGRTLKYYYPTDESDSKRNYVSPKFLSSSYHGSFGGQVSYNGAKKRCAAYQEDGYPAGRWRLATKGEFEFLMYLSKEGYIDPIYETSSSGRYWFAAGWYQNGTWDELGSSDFSGRRGSVRCVYDLWYWEEIDKKLGYVYDPATPTTAPRVNYTKTFYWGDVPRNF